MSDELEFRTAIAEAMAECLAEDERTIFYGEDVAVAGGVFKATPGLHERFGDERVFDTPISELAMVGAAFGAAVTGLRPVVEVMFGDFMTLAMDSLVNQAAKWWYLSNDTVRVPLVIRSAVGAGGSFGAIHSQNPAPWFLSTPGLKIVCPAFPADAKSLLKAAIRDDNPVLFLEHKRLYSLKGPRLEDDGDTLGSARVVREGSDVTIVALQRGVHDALAAAEELQADGVSAEVLDPRCLRPLDLELDPALGREDEPAARRRRGRRAGQLGQRGARRRRPARARPRRRPVAAARRAVPGAVQPAVRARLPAEQRRDRRHRARARRRHRHHHRLGS